MDFSQYISYSSMPNISNTLNANNLVLTNILLLCFFKLIDKINIERFNLNFNVLFLIYDYYKLYNAKSYRKIIANVEYYDIHNRKKVSYNENNLIKISIFLYFNVIKNVKRGDILYFDLNSNNRKYNTLPENYCLTVIPNNNTWIRLDEYIEFRYNKMNDGDRQDHYSERKLDDKYIFEFISSHDDINYIDNFINKVITWYKRQKNPVSTYLYYYMLNVTYETYKGLNSRRNRDRYDEDDDESESNEIVSNVTKIYTRYKVSENKTFDSLFIPNKTEILNLVDDFIYKKNKYSIKGYTRKLGFLLYGLPGTGKTSFIKCLANYTKRHIINVELSKMKTNQDLFNAIYNLNLKTTDSEFSIQYTFKDVIFIIEDIDSTIDIIKQRINTDDLVSNDNSNKKEIFDKLNLSGILNALDGAIDSDDRIIVITTNYKDKIDNALLRPGRIDKMISFDNIKKHEIIAMLNYYYSTCINEDNCLISAIEKKEISPATLETKCLEYETIKSLEEHFMN